MKAIDQVSGGVKFTKNLDLGVELTTHSAKEAEKLRDAVQMIIGMAAQAKRTAGA